MASQEELRTMVRGELEESQALLADQASMGKWDQKGHGVLVVCWEVVVIQATRVILGELVCEVAEECVEQKDLGDYWARKATQDPGDWLEHEVQLVHKVEMAIQDLLGHEVREIAKLLSAMRKKSCVLVKARERNARVTRFQ